MPSLDCEQLWIRRRTRPLSLKKNNDCSQSMPSCASEISGTTLFPNKKIKKLRTSCYALAMSLKETYSICCIADSKGRTLPYTLVQYLFKGEEHQIRQIRPHGNAKKKTSYRRVQSSTREKLKESAFVKSKTAKESLDDVYRSLAM